MSYCPDQICPGDRTDGRTDGRTGRKPIDPSGAGAVGAN